jgi:hypothetical protein
LAAAAAPAAAAAAATAVASEAAAAAPAPERRHIVTVLHALREAGQWGECANCANSHTPRRAQMSANADSEAKFQVQRARLSANGVPNEACGQLFNQNKHIDTDPSINK